MRAAIRVAALSELQAVYILTHDSVGVGEDGPTHQPVEAVSGLRTIPNLDVLRPADPEEVAGAFACSVERQDGPTALIFSRQNVRTLNEIPVAARREGMSLPSFSFLPSITMMTMMMMNILTSTLCFVLFLFIYSSLSIFHLLRLLIYRVVCYFSQVP